LDELHYKSVFIFFSACPMSKYCDAKSDLENFTLRNIVIIVHVRLQFPSREALAISAKSKSLPVLGRGISPQRMEEMTHTEKNVRVCSTVRLANDRRAQTICCLFLPYTIATTTLFRKS